MRNFMRQISASKLFRRNAQNKKSMHPQNEKVMQEFVRSFSLPQAWKRALPLPHNSAIEKPLLMKKLNRMAAFAPPRSPQGLGGPIPKNWGQTELALSQQVRIQSEQQRKNRRALAVKQEEGRPAASAGLRGRFPSNGHVQTRSHMALWPCSSSMCIRIYICINDLRSLCLHGP